MVQYYVKGKMQNAYDLVCYILIHIPNGFPTIVRYKFIIIYINIGKYYI